jgi:hypothetical protein
MQLQPLKQLAHQAVNVNEASALGGASTFGLPASSNPLESYFFKY